MHAYMCKHRVKCINSNTGEGILISCGVLLVMEKEKKEAGGHEGYIKTHRWSNIHNQTPNNKAKGQSYIGIVESGGLVFQLLPLVLK